MRYIECWKLSNISADIAVDIFRVNIYWLGIFWKPYLYKAGSIDGKWDVTNAIGGVKKQLSVWWLDDQDVMNVVGGDE
jgi:hypothetical protein